MYTAIIIIESQSINKITEVELHGKFKKGRPIKHKYKSNKDANNMIMIVYLDKWYNISLRFKREKLYFNNHITRKNVMFFTIYFLNN